MISYLVRRWSSNRHKPVVRVSTALAVALTLNICFGTAFYFAERGVQTSLSIWDSIWWAMVTMTTVGYGDFFPKTFFGRFFVAYPCLVLGIGLIGYVLSIIAETMLEKFNKRQKGNSTMYFENHLVICQCPSVPRVIQLVEQFRKAQGDSHRHAVVVSNHLDELPAEFREKSIDFVKGLPTSEEVLIRAGVASAAGVIVLARDRNDESSDSESFTAGTLVRLIEEGGKRSISVVIELADRRNLRMMERAGADGIVPAEGITDMLLTQEMCNPGLRHVFENLVTHDTDCEFYIVPQKFAGRSMREIQIAALDHPSNLQVVGALRDGVAIMTPEKSLRLAPQDQLIVLAEKRANYDAFEATHLTSKPLPQTT